MFTPFLGLSSLEFLALICFIILGVSLYWEHLQKVYSSLRLFSILNGTMLT